MTAREPSAASPLASWSGAIGAALIVLSLVGLVVLWTWDRTHHFETPRFEVARFVPLTRAGDAPARARWVVAVNPDCPRCQDQFPAIAQRHAASAPGTALEVLLVDAAHRPPPAALAAFPSERAWWDSAGVWRHAWGHRVYSEVLRFRADGTLIATDPPPREE